MYINVYLIYICVHARVSVNDFYIMSRKLLSSTIFVLPRSANVRARDKRDEIAYNNSKQ